jgi:copper homeostasis protein (lipoprotein)
MTRIPHRIIAACLALALHPAASRGASAPRDTASVLGALPARFTGQLPCADCAGIRIQIDLLPPGAYLQRMTYLRNDRDESFYQLGRWSLSADRHTLSLDGGPGGTARWQVADSLTLQKLDADGRPIQSAHPYALRRSPKATPIEPRLELSGMFTPLAEAGRFKECRTGLEWPVATSDDYLSLVRAYNAQRAVPGAALRVSLRGRVEQRPDMEDPGMSDVLVPTLVVEAFLAAKPGETCAESGTGAGLENTRWRPIRIGDQAVLVAQGQQEPWIVLESRSKQVTGYAGCNRFSGGYDAGESTLRFAPMASTKVYCDRMDTETRFMQVLGETRGYRVSGRTLELLDEAGHRLAQLEERNL